MSLRLIYRSGHLKGLVGAVEAGQALLGRLLRSKAELQRVVGGKGQGVSTRHAILSSPLASFSLVTPKRTR